MASVVLVDQHDNELGIMEKLEAHQKGVLHRAVSVLIFNSKGEWLLQQRAARKYHSPLLWTNTCCSHPLPDEPADQAAHRRLREEMGMDVQLDFLFSFKYHAPLDNGLIEHELDHVFVGRSDDKPFLNTEETTDYRYVTTEALKTDMLRNADRYTEWFKILFPKTIGMLK